jgi:hypothetical protein
MPSLHSREARHGALGADDEPQDGGGGLAGEQIHFPDKSKPAAKQAPVRAHRKSGLNRKEERHRLSRPKAEALAGKIRQFWEAKGFRLKVWVEPIDDARIPEYAVRSTLIFRSGPPLEDQP